MPKRRRRRNPSLSRRKRTGLYIAFTGIATGLAAVLLWPKIHAAMQQPLITVQQPTLKLAMLTPAPANDSSVIASLAALLE